MLLLLMLLLFFLWYLGRVPLPNPSDFEAAFEKDAAAVFHDPTSSVESQCFLIRRFKLIAQTLECILKIESSPSKAGVPVWRVFREDEARGCDGRKGKDAVDRHGKGGHLSCRNGELLLERVGYCFETFPHVLGVLEWFHEGSV